MAATVVQSGNPTILTGGTAWATMFTGFSTTPGWRAEITEGSDGLKRLHLTVWVGEASRVASNSVKTCTYSDAPTFSDTPTWSAASWAGGTGNQLNAGVEHTITSWSNGTFKYIAWTNGTTGNYKIGHIFTFDGFTTQALS